jgi:hypothetical protein
MAFASGFALCLLVFAIVPSVQAASPTPIAQAAGGPSGGDCFRGICDPGAWLQDAVGRILTNVLGGADQRCSHSSELLYSRWY